jgi:tetratricopeptide (TPR) repeat protein
MHDKFIADLNRAKVNNIDTLPLSAEALVNLRDSRQYDDIVAHLLSTRSTGIDLLFALPDLLSLGRYADVNAVATKLLTIQRSSNAYGMRASAKLLSGDSTGAEQDIREAISLDGNNAYLESLLAVSISEHDQWNPEIATIIERAITLDPNNSELEEKLGEQLDHQDRWDDAWAHFTRSLQIAPTNYLTYDDMAQAYLSRGHGKEAAKYLTSAIALTDAPFPPFGFPPKRFGCVTQHIGVPSRDDIKVKLLSRRALALWSSSKKSRADAENDLTRALQLNTNPIKRHELNFQFAEMQGKYQEAWNEINIAIKMQQGVRELPGAVTSLAELTKEREVLQYVCPKQVCR